MPPLADIESVRKGPGVGRPQSAIRVTIAAEHYAAVKDHLDKEYIYPSRRSLEEGRTRARIRARVETMASYG